MAALLLVLLAVMGGWADGALASESGRLAAGGSHTCAIKADGTPVCWGNDTDGRATIPAGIGTVTQISAGESHTCAIKTDGTPVCWGSDNDGQATVPVGVGTVTQIAGGGYHTCAIKTDGNPVCWGADDVGQSTIPPGTGTVTRITAGEEHTCAIKTDGTPVCWGDDFYEESTIPAGIGTVTQISAGGHHTCAIKTDGTPVCWGADGNQHQSTIPAGVGTVTQITAGGVHTCAIETGGAPVCWGGNDFGQATVPAGIGTVTQITGGDFFTCAIKTDNTPICWGSHINGQLGGSPIIDSGLPPSLVGVGPFSHTYTAEQPLGGLGADGLVIRFFFSSGSLPPGLTLDGTTGVLSGTPTADGTYTGVVSATNDVFSPDATQPFSITVDTTAPAAPSDLASTPSSPSPNLQPGIVGTAEAGSTVRLYDNETCTGSPRSTGSAAIFASPGLQITVTAGSTTTVYATATDAAGNTSGCSTSKATYVNAEDSMPGTGTPTDAGTGTLTDPGTAIGIPLRPRACVVPKLVGKTLARAKKALKSAGCRLGKVTKPRRLKDTRRRVLVVKSASPRRGARPADRRVNLKLRVKPKARR